MPKWLLIFVNDVFSRSKLVGVTAYITISFLVWGLIQGVNSSLGVQGSWRRFIGEVGLSLALPLGVMLLGPLRWHMIYRSLRSEIKWFRRKEARILVGVGPGGAILAGMVAKLMAELDGREPEIIVIDRVYEVTEYNEIRVSAQRAAERLDRGLVGVVVVTPEIHGGQTVIAVGNELRKVGIEAPVFSYLWSAKSARMPRHDVDHFVLRTNERGILPWPDAPSKESSS